MSVLCLPNGKAYTAVLVFGHSSDSYRHVAWRPVTTFIGALPPHSRERIDTFDTTGRLAEYATLDREAQRVEFYSAASQLTGYGRLDPSSGRVERFGLDGQRLGAPALPIPPPIMDW